jgi:hypothetical protein
MLRESSRCGPSVGAFDAGGRDRDSEDNARIATSKDVADELWQIATKYQDQAAKLGEVPELGDEPPLWKLAR